MWGWRVVAYLKAVDKKGGKQPTTGNFVAVGRWTLEEGEESTSRVGVARCMPVWLCSGDLTEISHIFTHATFGDFISGLRGQRCNGESGRNQLQ